MGSKVVPEFRQTAEAFTADARTLPQRYLVSSEIFTLEQERIFSKQWLCVGHQSKIAQAIILSPMSWGKA